MTRPEMACAAGAMGFPSYMLPRILARGRVAALVLLSLAVARASEFSPRFDAIVARATPAQLCAVRDVVVNEEEGVEQFEARSDVPLARKRIEDAAQLPDLL